MKHLLLLKLFVLSLALPSLAQEVIKLKLQKPVTNPRAIANNFINAFRNTRSKGSLDSLKTFLQTIKSGNAFFKKADSLFKKLPAEPDTNLTLDSFAITKTDPVAGDCDLLMQVSDLKVEKTPDAEYVFSLVDVEENPLRSFTLKQFNEALLKDKLKQALYGLCGKSALSAEENTVITGLIEAFDDNKLYDMMLEASLEVNDEEVLAGVLKINKHLKIYIKKRVDTAGRKKETVFLHKKNAQYNFVAGSNRLNTLQAEYGKSTSGNKTTKQNTFQTASVGEGLTQTALMSDMTSYTTGNPRDTAGTLMIEEVHAFTVHEIQIQFQDGFIENIKVLGKMEGDNRLLKF